MNKTSNDWVKQYIAKQAESNTGSASAIRVRKPAVEEIKRIDPGAVVPPGQNITTHPAAPIPNRHRPVRPAIHTHQTPVASSSQAKPLIPPSRQMTGWDIDIETRVFLFGLTLQILWILVSCVLRFAGKLN